MGQHYSLGYDGHNGRHSMLHLCLDVDENPGELVISIHFSRLTWLVSQYDSENVYFPFLISTIFMMTPS